MKHKRLKPAKDKEWIQPMKRGYLMGCCDCGLVHRLDFRIVNDRVQFRAERANGYTRRERKRMGIRVTL